MEFTTEQKKEIEKMIDARIIFMIPKMFSRSIVQLKEYFIKNIL